MSGIHAFGTAARYSWTRVRRTWWLPAAVAGGLATGLVTVTQTVAGTGVGVLQQAAQFLAFLQVGVMVLAGLAADPERDEDSAAVFWSWPADTAALVLGKLAGAAPLALLAALGAALPPAVQMARLGQSAGLPWTDTLAHWGLLLAFLLPGAAWAWAVGSALGLWLRGLPLLAAILATWLAGVLGPYVFQALFNPFFPVAWLLQWTGSGMLPDDFVGVDLPGIAGDVPLILAHRALYLAATGAVVAGLALVYRRRRSVGAGPRWGLGLVAGVLGVATLALAGESTAVLYARADAGREEILYYARPGVVYPQGALDPWTPPEPDEPPNFAISRYDLDVDARRPPELRVEARLRLENRGRAAVADPGLTLRHVFTVTRLEVEEPAAGNGDVHWQRKGDVLHLQGLVLPPGGVATVVVSYRGPVDQWILPSPYPPRRMGATFVPEVWRGAHVASFGLFLPPSYGWYPLPGAVTLAKAISIPHRADDADQGGLWLDEGPATGWSVLRWAGPAAPDPPPPREDLRAAFHLRVRHGGRYPVLSNLKTIEAPWGPVTTMEGTTAFLELVGRPLARLANGQAEIWYPPAGRSSRQEALQWAGWLRAAYQWFGQATVPRIITVPPVGIARIDRLHLDPDSGALIEKGSAAWSPTEAMYALLLGSREAASPAEQCLLGAFSDADVLERLLAGDRPPGAAAAPGPTAAGGPQVGSLSPCDRMDGGPSYEQVKGWLLQAPRPQVEAGLQRLRQLAAQRPLEARDLREVMGR